MKSVAITGATGFIGAALIKYYLSKGYRVHAIVRDKSKVAVNGIIPQMVECDFDHYDTLSGLIGESIDVVIHAAWAGVYGPNHIDVNEQLNNLRASISLFEQSDAMKVKKFLFIGSIYEYRMEPYDLDGVIKYDLLNIYGCSKRMTKEFLSCISRKSKVQYFKCMLGNTYGPGDYSKRSVNTLISKMMKNDSIKLIKGDRVHDWVYIDDTVRGIDAVINKGRPDTEYYIGHRTLIPFRKIVSNTKEVLNSSSNLRFGDNRDESYIDYDSINTNLLYEDTGFECNVGFEDGVTNTVGWLKNEGLLEKISGNG